jgi:2-methylisocitrate lyase-like PEP mutase family enzyme
VTTRTDDLRALLDGDDQFIAAGASTVLTARIAERVGFPAIYVGGHAVGVLHYGLPDYGILEPHEMIEQSGRIADSVSLPVIVDADELGGNVATLHRTVRDYERAGIAGLHLEDDQEPKHSTYRAPLLSIEEMQARIAATVASRTDPNFVIIARSNELINRAAYGQGSLEEAIKRGQAYAEAGADSYVTPGIQPDEMATLAKAIPIPYTAFSAPLGQGDGVKMVLSTGWETATAARVYEQSVVEYLKSNTVPAELRGRATEFYSLLEEGNYVAIVTEWVERTGRPLGKQLRAMQ